MVHGDCFWCGSTVGQVPTSGMELVAGRGSCILAQGAPTLPAHPGWAGRMAWYLGIFGGRSALGVQTRGHYPALRDCFIFLYDMIKSQGRGWWTPWPSPIMMLTLLDWTPILCIIFVNRRNSFITFNSTWSGRLDRAENSCIFNPLDLY